MSLDEIISLGNGNFVLAAIGLWRRGKFRKGVIYPLTLISPARGEKIWGGEIASSSSEGGLLAMT